MKCTSILSALTCSKIDSVLLIGKIYYPLPVDKIVDWSKLKMTF